MRKKLSSTIVKLYLGMALVFLVLSFLSDNSLDIAIKDTYFVIAHKQICYLLLGFCILVSLLIHLYSLSNKALNSMVLWIHFLVTFISLLGIVLIEMIYFSPATTYQDSTVLEEFQKADLYNMNKWITILAFAFLLVQLLFYANMMLNLFKRKANKN